MGEIFPTSAKLGKEPSPAPVVIIEMASPDLAQDPKDLTEPGKEKIIGAKYPEETAMEKLLGNAPLDALSSNHFRNYTHFFHCLAPESTSNDLSWRRKKERTQLLCPNSLLLTLKCKRGIYPQNCYRQGLEKKTFYYLVVNLGYQ